MNSLFYSTCADSSNPLSKKHLSTDQEYCTGFSPHWLPAYIGNERTFDLNQGPLLALRNRAKGVDHSLSCSVTGISAPWETLLGWLLQTPGVCRMYLCSISYSLLYFILIAFILLESLRNFIPAVICLFLFFARFFFFLNQPTNN